MVDRRVQRTRHALVQAYNKLVLNRRPAKFGVPEIVKQAGVGRSTFYDHYSGADALHLDALRGPFEILADAATGAGDESKLTRLLEHFWEYRERARLAFDNAAERLLATMIEDRLEGVALTVPIRIAARQLAAAALTPISAWVRAEAWCPPAELASAICRSGRAQRQALARAPD